MTPQMFLECLHLLIMELHPHPRRRRTPPIKRGVSRSTPVWAPVSSFNIFLDARLLLNVTLQNLFQEMVAGKLRQPKPKLSSKV